MKPKTNQKTNQKIFKTFRGNKLWQHLFYFYLMFLPKYCLSAFFSIIKENTKKTFVECKEEIEFLKGSKKLIIKKFKKKD